MRIIQIKTLARYYRQPKIGELISINALRAFDRLLQKCTSPQTSRWRRPGICCGGGGVKNASWDDHEELFS